MIRRLIILLLIVGCVFAREYIAIIDFEGIGVSEDEARALTQRLTSEMIALEVYQVVERSEMKRLLEEQKFQYSGCVDMKCAVEVGKMLGAKYMAIGSVSKLGNSYSIDSRMIDVATSEAYVSGSYVVEEKIDVLLTKGTKSIARQLCELEKIDIKINQSNLITKNNYHSFAIGATTPKIGNLIEYNYNTEIYKDLFVYTSIGYTIQPVFGFGLSWKNNYNKSGWNAGTGVMYFSEYLNIDDYVIVTQIYYQWKLWNSSYFFSLGISDSRVGSSADSKVGRSGYNYQIPVLSLERNF